MPSTNVVFYQEQEGDAPVVEWLKEQNETNSKAYDKCRAAIARKAAFTANPTAHTFRGEIHDA
jgi:hypothetical protein